jgi:hypothetical protein
VRKYGFLFIVCLCSFGAFAQQDFHLQYRAGPSTQYQVVSAEDIKQLATQGAAIDAINFRLGSIDDNLKGIRTKLDNDVMPTIHVMDFFKWFFALIVAAIVGAAVNNYAKSKPRPNPTTT